MKVLVTYRTITGNTKKIADAIFGEIECDKEIKSFNEVESLDGYDFIFVGCPIEFFGAGNATKKWLDKHVEGKRIGLFCTHGAPEIAPGVPIWTNALKTTAVDAGAVLVSFFNCQGELSQKVLDMMLADKDPYVRKLAGFGREATIGQPDETRVQKACQFAQETMKKVSMSGTHFET
ncbi:MAG: flavodoxin family protein [Candidatus Thorarchaeota archaeon]